MAFKEDIQRLSLQIQEEYRIYFLKELISL